MDGGGGGDGGGIDHGHDHGDHGHDMGGHPDQSPIWSQAMQGLKLDDFINSIRITPNHLLLFMFAAFTGWLGVIYWIRHHEPMANHMLGSGPAYTPHFQADRLLINGAREALPIKTVAGSGQVYTPGSTPVAPVLPVYSSGVRFSTPRQNLAVQSSAINAPPSAINAPGSGNYAASNMSQGAPHAMSPMSNGMGHNSRLFSNRDMVGPGGHTGIVGRQAPVRTIIQAPAPQPVVQPGWSLAKDGFSASPAQFDSRFGTPAESFVESDK